MSKITTTILFSLCLGLLAPAFTAVGADRLDLRPDMMVADEDPADSLSTDDAPASSEDDARAEEPAEEEPSQVDLGGVQFSGQIFANYSRNVSSTGPTESFNSFALNRWYLTVKSSLTDDLGFRGTTDVKPTDTGYTVIVKYAYVDWGLQPWLSLRAGVQQTGWQNYVNKVWGYRGVAKTMAQYQGHLSMADLGASLTADLPNNLGQATVAVLNGQGYRSLEADRFKDVTGHVKLTPFADAGNALEAVEVGGHYYDGQYTDGQTRQRWGGMLAYNADRFTLAVNYDSRKDGDISASGVSGFGTVRLADVPQLGSFSLLGLVDVYQVDDPNDVAFEGQMMRSIVGLAYQPSDGFTLSLDYQRDHADAPIYDQYDGEVTDVDADLYLHIILDF